MKHPPIKRHTSMQPFSRDHYAGLVVAQHLLRAANDTADSRRRAVREFVDAWQREIRSHFDEEERLLIPLVDQPGEITRLYREHRNLRRFAEQAERRINENDFPPQWVRELGQQLRDHIRWEERVLFGLIEQDATDDELEILGHETERIEALLNQESSQSRTES